MLNSKKTTVVAGILGSFALLGVVNAAQAYGDGAYGTCSTDADGSVRCVQKSESHYTTDEDGHVTVKTKQSCTTSSGTHSHVKSENVSQGLVVTCTNK